jgi:hypothetical protein
MREKGREKKSAIFRTLYDLVGLCACHLLDEMEMVGTHVTIVPLSH